MKSKPLKFPLILWLFLTSLQSNAQSNNNHCIDLFAPSDLITDIDPEVNTKNYHRDTADMLSRGLSLDVIESLYDQTLLGIYGKIGRLKTEAGKTEFIVDSEKLDRIKAERKLINDSLPDHFSDKARALFHKYIKVKKLTDDKVLVTFRYYNFDQPNEIQQKIINVMNLNAATTVNYVYRKAGLISNDTYNSFKVLDEMLSYFKRLFLFEQFQIFDQKAWNWNERFFLDAIDRYLNANSEVDKKNILSSLDPFDLHFLPLAGISRARHILDSNQPVELKRYFSHENSDPLCLIENRPSSEQLLRYMMLIEMVRDLPENQKLEVHAHTRVHMLAYRKLGFDEVEEYQDEKFPENTHYLLKSTKIKALLKLEQALNRLMIKQK